MTCSRDLRALLLALLLAGCSNAAATGTAYDRGVAALEGGDPRTARVEFLNAIRENPNDSAAHLMQARTHVALGDGIAAETAVVRARTLGAPTAETGPLMAHALILQGRMGDALTALEDASDAYAERMRGRALAALGEEDAAAKAYRAAAALAPEDSALWTDIARFHRARGATADAIAASERAVAADAENTDALVLRGELVRTQYGLRASLAWFDRAIRIDPGNINARLERAATLADMGATRAMLEETRKVLDRSPGNPMAYYLQALLAARAGDFPLARGLYQRSQGRLEPHPATMLLQAAIDFEVGDAVRAAGRLQELVERQPDNRKLRRLLAAARLKAGDAAGAAAAIRPLADAEDADIYSLRLMAAARMKQGDQAGALPYLRRSRDVPATGGSVLRADRTDLPALRAAAAADPADALLQVGLIRALLSASAHREAIDRARTLLAHHPAVPEAHLVLGDSLAAAGHFAEAAERYRQAANIAFTEPAALRLAEALRNSGRADAAGDVLALFLHQNPNNATVRLLVAGRQAEARQWDEAIRSYALVRRQLGDRDGVMLVNLAWAHAERGEDERALAIAKKAWSLAPDYPATARTYGWMLYRSGDRIPGIVLLHDALRREAFPAN